MTDEKDPGNQWTDKPLSVRLQQVRRQWINLGERQLIMLDNFILSAEHLEEKVRALEEDAGRFRWFRDQCDGERRMDIVEAADESGAMLEHHIDKGRCGL